MVAEAKSKRMDEIIVKYIRELGSPCITTQTLDPKNEWKTISSRYFCSINGRSFLNDFADAHFESLRFSESGIDMTLSITPRMTDSEWLRHPYEPRPVSLSGAAFACLVTPPLRQPPHSFPLLREPLGRCRLFFLLRLACPLVRVL